MGDGAIRFDLVLGVLALTTLIAATAVAIGIIAFRRNHVLLERCEALLRRFGPAPEEEDQRHTARARINLMLLSAFLLWLAFVLCLVGLRAVLSSG